MIIKRREITLKWLKRMGACDRSITAFKIKFGESVELTKLSEIYLKNKHQVLFCADSYNYLSKRDFEWLIYKLIRYNSLIKIIRNYFAKCELGIGDLGDLHSKLNNTFVKLPIKETAKRKKMFNKFIRYLVNN
jgi:hypothetical protein